MKEKILLRSRTILRDGKPVEQVFVTKKILNHKLNAGKNIILGWNDVNPEINTFDDPIPPPPGDLGDCPDPTTKGYYTKIGGECVFVPY